MYYLKKHPMSQYSGHMTGVLNHPMSQYSGHMTGVLNHPMSQYSGHMTGVLNNHLSHAIISLCITFGFMPFSFQWC